jgi:hypothetical protein
MLQNSFADANHLLSGLVNSIMEDVSMKEGINDASTPAMLASWVDANMDWSVSTEIEILGLDEIGLKKGGAGKLVARWNYERLYLLCGTVSNA